MGKGTQFMAQHSEGGITPHVSSESVIFAALGGGQPGVPVSTFSYLCVSLSFLPFGLLYPFHFLHVFPVLSPKVKLVDLPAYSIRVGSC